MRVGALTQVAPLRGEHPKRATAVAAYFLRGEQPLMWLAVYPEGVQHE